MVVEFAFCLPGSNASIRRIFCMIVTTWTNVPNQIDIKTLECCLIIKTHDLSCMEFYNEVIKNHILLKKVHSTEKYKIDISEKNK